MVVLMVKSTECHWTGFWYLRVLVQSSCPNFTFQTLITRFCVGLGSRHVLFRAGKKDTVLVAVLGVLLHLLQVLLLTLEAPGVVLELRRGVAVAALQPVVEHLRLPQPLQLHVLLQLLEAGRQARDTSGTERKEP